tara:strand:+ start:218 stop:874 length:657 start_codon:yes stop_codon:yes gene_type:complete
MGNELKINKKLEKYISDHSHDLHPVQKEIISYNESLGKIKRMQISLSQAYFFQFLIKSFELKKILEVGTFTGYSALSMGLSLNKDGNIICLDKNVKTSTIAKNFFKKAKLDKKIQIINGQAAKSLKKFLKENKKFDMIFIDADKENYKLYYNLSVDLINSKGFILIDNVLWHGDVVDPNKNDTLTVKIREFNSLIKKDNRVEKIILPLGDGLTVCRKI